MNGHQDPHENCCTDDLEMQDSKSSSLSKEHSNTGTSSSSLDLDFEANYEKSTLLSVEGTGCMACLEKIPLSLKLIQTSILAVISMAVLGLFIVILRSVQLSQENAAVQVVQQKNTLYSALNAIFSERQSTILYFSAAPIQSLMDTMDRSRTGTDAAVTMVLNMPIFKRATTGNVASAITKLTNGHKNLANYRKFLDLYRIKRTGDSSSTWDYLSTFANTIDELVKAIRSLSDMLSDQVETTYNNYAVELMVKLSQVSHDLNGAMTLVLGVSHNITRDPMDTFKFISGYSAEFDMVEKFLLDQLPERLDNQFLESMDAKPYRRTIYAMKTVVIEQLVLNGSVAQIDTLEWSGNMTQYTDIVTNITRDWSWQFENSATTKTRLNIAFMGIYLLGVLISFIIVMCNGFMISKTITGPWQRMNTMLDRAISRFVPRDFLYLMKCNDITDVALGKAFSHDLTVMSLEIKQGVVTAHEIAPDVHIQILNHYFGFIGPIIRKHNGFIEKYLGHGCVALFTKPKNAVYAALELDRSIAGFCKGNPALPVFSLTIGIHSDSSVVVGTVGETQRMETAVLSNTSRFASAIRNMCRKLKTKILISESCISNVKKTWIQVQSRYMGKFTITTEQRQMETMLYEVFEESDYRAKNSIEFTDAVKLQEQGDVEGAIKTFQMILSEDSNDAATERQLHMCNVLIEHYSKEVKELTLRDILDNTTFREAFDKHLVYEMCNENMILWNTIQQALTVSDPELMRQKAMEIYKEFLDVHGKYQLNLNQEAVFSFKDEMENMGKPFNSKILNRLQSQAEFLMMDSFKRFKYTPQLKQLLTSMKQQQHLQQHDV